MGAHDLFSYADHFRSGPGFKDRDTSRAAAVSMDRSAPRLRRLVLAALQELGPMTPDEVAQHLSMSILSIRPRFSELSKGGAIKDTGERRQNASGRAAKVWALV